MSILESTVDVKEDDLRLYSHGFILNLLLKDKTTKRNIIWATNDYIHLGNLYSSFMEIYPDQITGYNSNVIQPRICKKQVHQANRTREKAEVFTPSWMCNIQNNLIDEKWFGYKDVFNIQNGKQWSSNLNKIKFPKGKRWEDYVDARRMEITCGEAPYLVSRYDTVTGIPIPLKERIGLLDRKLRVVNENTKDYEVWFKWVIRAFQSVYAYEFQGDNLLLARENLLCTFIDNVKFKFKRDATDKELKKLANIIAWNVWQMDGHTWEVPFANKLRIVGNRLNFVDFFDKNKFYKKFYCTIKDWRANSTLLFKDLSANSKQSISHRNKYKVIYVYKLNSEHCKGLLKIGFSEFETDLPIEIFSPFCKKLQKIVNSSLNDVLLNLGETPEIIWAELYMKKDSFTQGNYSFIDEDSVVKELRKKNIKEIDFANTSGWFNTDIENMKDAINNVKNNI